MYYGSGFFVAVVLSASRSFYTGGAPASSCSLDLLVTRVCQGLVCGVRLLNGKSLWSYLLAFSLPLWCVVRFKKKVVV